MNAKEAKRTARDYITDAFAADEITNLGLEGVVYDPRSKQWLITFNFYRPWSRQDAENANQGNQE